jgi:hypothetical protein
VLIKWVGYLIGVIVLLAAAQIGWGMYREPIAKKEALDFCATVRVGQSIDGIEERAIASGAVKPFAKWQTVADGSIELLVIYVGMPPFSRHLCSIRATDAVVSATYSHLD